MAKRKSVFIASGRLAAWAIIRRRRAGRRLRLRAALLAAPGGGGGLLGPGPDRRLHRRRARPPPWLRLRSVQGAMPGLPGRRGHLRADRTSSRRRCSSPRALGSVWREARRPGGGGPGRAVVSPGQPGLRHDAGPAMPERGDRQPASLRNGEPSARASGRSDAMPGIRFEVALSSPGGFWRWPGYRPRRNCCRRSPTST